MRILLVIAALALTACGGGSSGDAAHPDTGKKADDAAQAAEPASDEADDSLYESVRKPLDKAESVEDTVQQAKKDTDKAIEDASD
jgi:hypothetical protein